MRFRISHETTFEYAPPTRWTIQNVRLTPRSFDSQYVLRWRLSVDLDGAMRLFEDSLLVAVRAEALGGVFLVEHRADAVAIHPLRAQERHVGRAGAHHRNGDHAV